jgi:2-polyprenyl-6-methoxyphenol hydroxylase-like FAD-dependent oxidoreductase
MQFHDNGFRVGDPHFLNAAPGAALHAPDAPLPAQADVLIVGCGPAGLTLAAQLAAFPEIKTVIVDQKLGPLQLGQADGIACRTMEMFEAFGFVERVLKESYFVNETTFWKPDPAQPGQIVRSGRVPDVEEGLSHMPHVILNQARVHDFYLDIMAHSQARLSPYYGRKFLSLERRAEQGSTYPLQLSFERQDAAGSAKVETIEARYLVGCDGARSAVRQAIGRSLQGDSANQAWGVMDVLVVTDFPDIRFKSLIQSSGEGSVVLIPREGGYLVRIYVELEKLNPNERVVARNITIDQLIAAAQRIFKPYTLEVKEVAWWSVYEIGQRLCDKFDDITAADAASANPRVFIAGDACHTHSPKAGQGMNVSMQDAFNLGWKLAGVLKGRYPASLLHSYSAERHAIAKQLIDFDREWAKMLSAPLRKAGDPPGVGMEPAQVQQYFVQHGRYTAGTATRYTPALLTGESRHQHLAAGLPIGMRFHSAPVIRIGDGKHMQLGQTAGADGRWQLVLFAPEGDSAGEQSALRALCTWLQNDVHSPIVRHTAKGADIDSLFDVRAVFQQSHHALAVTAMPPLLFPPKGKLGLRDYEKAFCTTTPAHHDIYAVRSISRETGCIVVVRPDQYVAHVLPLQARQELTDFFARFMQSGNTA